MQYGINRGRVLWVACLAISVHTAHAFTISVPGDFLQIQPAIDAARNGDTVLVRAGIYAENIDFKGKSIHVIGEKGYLHTRIVGNNSGPVVRMESGEPSTAELRGFTIKGGYGSEGGGVSMMSASPLILHNRFILNSGSLASAVGGNGSSPTIDGNLFEQQNCSPSDFLSGVMVFINESSPHIVNNIVRGNPCTAVALTLPEGNTPIVSNNTLVDNDTGIVVDARIPTRLETYQNNIITGSRHGLRVLFLSAGNQPTFMNNDVTGNRVNYSGIPDLTLTNGNISVDPIFIGASRRDFRLAAGSPCIDAGASVASITDGKIGEDAYGAKRLVDGDGNGTKVIDIGAAEYQRN